MGKSLLESSWGLGSVPNHWYRFEWVCGAGVGVGEKGFAFLDSVDSSSSQTSVQELHEVHTKF